MANLFLMVFCLGTLAVIKFVLWYYFPSTNEDAWQKKYLPYVVLGSLTLGGILWAVVGKPGADVVPYNEFKDSPCFSAQYRGGVSC